MAARTAAGLVRAAAKLAGSARSPAACSKYAVEFVTRRLPIDLENPLQKYGVKGRHKVKLSRSTSTLHSQPHLLATTITSSNVGHRVGVTVTLIAAWPIP